MAAYGHSPCEETEGDGETKPETGRRDKGRDREMEKERGRKPEGGSEGDREMESKRRSRGERGRDRDGERDRGSLEVSGNCFVLAQDLTLCSLGEFSKF